MSESLPPDDILVMLSALQHYMFCPRQCALIHIEGAWSENYLTATGRALHERVDRRGGETRRDLHQATALRLVNRRLGLTGVADMVEFRRADAATDADGRRIAAPLAGLSGFWRPFPVEYKRGEPKAHRSDEVQLCAQALCLEEMLNVEIPAGALFYGATRRRVDVAFDAALRELTERVAREAHALIVAGETPPPTFGKWCASCSLVEVCQPESMNGKSARSWLARQIDQSLKVEDSLP